MVMEYKKRIIEKKLIELFRYYPVIAVLGARQVGKSTLVCNQRFTFRPKSGGFSSTFSAA